jgi:predicted permease
MALAVVLLAGAGVMIRSYLKIHTANIGVNTANVLGGTFNLPADRYPRAEDKISFFNRLMARLEGMPGVESVATADNLPTWGSSKFPYQLNGDPPADEGHRPELSALKISPAYFRTLGASLLSGREFNDADVASGVPVAIVNQLFASKYWPGEDPLGKRFRIFDGNTPEPWRAVVGVASNIIQNDQTRQRIDPMVYLPYRQKPGGEAWVLVRTRVPAAGLTNAFRREFLALDAGIPLYGPMAINERLERFWDSRFYGTLFVVFAAIALLLSAIGLYTVIANATIQRTQEIGVRMAIGATAPDILRLVLKQGMLPLGIGLSIGLAASLAVNRLLQSMLIQVSPSDPITLVVASTVLILSAALGCLIPARRAMRVDPAVALRNE